ncbi:MULTISPECIES: hypothetical protein [Bradyrhizobium]|uniref:hypothetical protein n=1 Tax=Bradyrhizobium elkanii TaxID=29448 RepID=UPI0004856B64
MERFDGTARDALIVTPRASGSNVDISRLDDDEVAGVRLDTLKQGGSTSEHHAEHQPAFAPGCRARRPRVKMPVEAPSRPNVRCVQLARHLAVLELHNFRRRILHRIAQHFEMGKFA